MDSQSHSKSLFRTFLAIDRFKHLFSTYHKRSRETLEPTLNGKAALAAVLITIVLIGIIFLQVREPNPSLDLPTVAFGVSALLALLLRKRMGLVHQSVVNWRESLTLTHSAFAVGCIPAIVVVALAPNLLANRHDFVATTVLGPEEAAATPEQTAITIGMILALLIWVAVTEELIFRGLLLSVLRRWNFVMTQPWRDAFAIGVSAILFGLAHYATWGPFATLALISIGAGFGIAYVANGERIAPLILYHFLFDLLSLSAALLV